MNKRAVYFHVQLAVTPGKLDAFKQIAEMMIAVTRNEPGALAYEWYLSDDGNQCRLVETYANENAVAAHMTGRAVQELVPKLLEVSSISAFEVYGDPGPKSAEALMGIGAELFQRWNGLAGD